MEKRRGDCIYLQVLVQMYIRGWDSLELSRQTGIAYTSMRRKLRGQSPISLEEARRIQSALNCGMSLDDLFALRPAEKKYPEITAQASA